MVIKILECEQCKVDYRKKYNYCTSCGTELYINVIENKWIITNYGCKYNEGRYTLNSTDSIKYNNYKPIGQCASCYWTIIGIISKEKGEFDSDNFYSCGMGDNKFMCGYNLNSSSGVVRREAEKHGLECKEYVAYSCKKCNNINSSKGRIKCKECRLFFCEDHINKHNCN